jgi:hypothetical protein
MKATAARRVLAALAIVSGTLPLEVLAAGPTSYFDTDAEGWTALGDFAVPVTWVAAGGNPGGNISVVDSVSGGVMYFVAPAKFLGDQLAAFGQTLSFDLKQHISGGPNPFDAIDVLLAGGGLTLVLDTAANPAFDAWTHYSVDLSSGAWHVSSLGGAVATNAQIKAALGSLSALQIRAEYQTGSDTDYLDNVVLATVPEPTTFALALAGLAVLGWHTRNGRAAVSGVAVMQG